MRSQAIFEDEPAYLLHRRPYQDKAWLVYFFTSTHGCLTTLARFSSRLNDNALQAFVPILLSCGGKGELLNVRSIEARGVAALNDADAQVHGLYVNELILRLLPPRHIFSHLFQMYVHTLMQLNRPSLRDVSVRRFEMETLKALGHGLPFAEEGCDFRIDSQAWYRCDPDAMPVRAYPQRAASLRDRHYHGRTLQALRDGLADDTEEDVLHEAKRLLERAINHCLGGKRLVSRNLFGYLSS